MRIRYWRRHYFGEDTSLIIAGVIIGVFGALGAVALKAGVSQVTRSLHGWLFGSDRAFLVLVIPLAGILLSVLFTKLWLNGDLGRGIPPVLKAVREKHGFVEFHKLYSQVVTSILTMGTGGSAGLEAPIAVTGAAWGSNIARWLKFDQGARILLLSCGAAAGISAIFNAPIAGAIFALEAILINIAIPMVVPVLIASASAAFVSSLIYKGQPFVLITDSWNAAALPYYFGLALFAALVSVHTIRLYHGLGARFSRIKDPWVKAVTGGLLLGVLILFFPPLLGEGYDSVEKLLHGQASRLAEHAPLMLELGPWNLVALVLGLMLLKVVATSLTLGGGGNGGMFGPALFIGAMCGFAFARTMHLLGLADLNEVNFTVVGMAAILSGSIHVPLTAIFLIAEITGGYALFVPLMLVSAISYLVSRSIQPYSIYGQPRTGA
ncbi:MAG: chloride channel protein [Bacteroidetes bacterium]|nr:chloride channel protein [Bacteroidota bacterium]